jgi:hypothetical protein
MSVSIFEQNHIHVIRSKLFKQIAIIRSKFDLNYSDLICQLDRQPADVPEGSSVHRRRCREEEEEEVWSAAVLQTRGDQND